ncbi:MAG: hypothetical protein GY916_10495, partial [Gammaproteobacteria bacterium]|nr:hypothetical protein [Gammaproteobacteria bacterium]
MPIISLRRPSNNVQMGASIIVDTLSEVATEQRIASQIAVLLIVVSQDGPGGRIAQIDADHIAGRRSCAGTVLRRAAVGDDDRRGTKVS